MVSKLRHHHERIQYGGLGNEHESHVNSTILYTPPKQHRFALQLHGMGSLLNVDMLQTPPHFVPVLVKFCWANARHKQLNRRLTCIYK